MLGTQIRKYREAISRLDATVMRVKSCPPASEMASIIRELIKAAWDVWTAYQAIDFSQGEYQKILLGATNDIHSD